MNKSKVVVATIGYMPNKLINTKKIKKHSSSVFEIIGEIENYALTMDADGTDWEFTDKALAETLPKAHHGDFIIALVNVPIEDNYYARRLSNNRIVFSFYEIKEILADANIPLENVIYRLLYSSSLLYKRSGNRIPTNGELTNFTHDETRGCLFDMNGMKTDLVYSCDKPIICPDCVGRLRAEMVSNDVISQTQKEIMKIRKNFFYRISDYIKRHPIRSLIISMVTAIFLNVLASYIYAYLTCDRS